jgi:hypothetical protein
MAGHSSLVVRAASIIKSCCSLVCRRRLSWMDCCLLVPCIPIKPFVDWHNASLLVHSPPTCRHVLDLPPQLGPDLGKDEGVIKGTPPTTLQGAATHIGTRYLVVVRLNQPSPSVASNFARHMQADTWGWCHVSFSSIPLFF